MNAWRWLLFGAMVIAQLAVPFSMIASHERTLAEGTAYKFRCGPVDPYDYLRGRYVALSFRDTTVEDWQGPYFERGERVYVHLEVDDAGFAKIEDVTAQPPASGDYLEVTVTSGGAHNRTLRFRFPFDKYFMNEFDAPAAETAYRNRSRTEEGAYVVVRVRDGQGVIAGLYIEDVPIEEYLRRDTEAVESAAVD